MLLSRVLFSEPERSRHVRSSADFTTTTSGFRFPVHTGVSCDAKPQNLSSAVPHDQQSIEQAKRDRRHDEQIHRRDAVGMVIKKRLPALRRWFSSLDHIFGNARLSGTDPGLEQLSVDPRRSPQRIGDAHLADRLAYLRRYSWSAARAPRLPAPIRSEAGAVPFYDGLRLHNRQCV